MPHFLHSPGQKVSKRLRSHKDSYSLFIDDGRGLLMKPMTPVGLFLDGADYEAADSIAVAQQVAYINYTKQTSKRVSNNHELRSRAG